MNFYFRLISQIYLYRKLIFKIFNFLQCKFNCHFNKQNYKQAFLKVKKVMMQENNNLMPVDEIWRQLSKVTTTVNRNVERMSQLLDQLITHTLSNECDYIDIPQRKDDHIKEREKYANDYKKFILRELNEKLNWSIRGSKNICNKCQMICKTRKGYLLHLLQKHCEYKFYLCVKCYDKFDNFNKFKQHLCNNHDEIMIFQVTEQIQQLIQYGVREISKNDLQNII
ncbi:unnamed protein product [Paramecium pentaurelia]|uniref:C2H2-type domain-containing protein n=1 Tax=Paramecium pentaurelia TaxID=43138 RepID=A0A8S1XWU4_9CILI|nr:unnamed protein product [Paramecium pentaurelia]